MKDGSKYNCPSCRNAGQMPCGGYSFGTWGSPCRPCLFYMRNHLWDAGWFVPFTSTRTLTEMTALYGYGAQYNANDGGTYLPPIRAFDPVIQANPAWAAMVRAKCTTPGEVDCWDENGDKLDAIKLSDGTIIHAATITHIGTNLGVIDQCVSKLPLEVDSGDDYCIGQPTPPTPSPTPITSPTPTPVPTPTPSDVCYNGMVCDSPDPSRLPGAGPGGSNTYIDFCSGGFPGSPTPSSPSSISTSLAVKLDNGETILVSSLLTPSNRVPYLTLVSPKPSITNYVTELNLMCPCLPKTPSPSITPVSAGFHQPCPKNVCSCTPDPGDLTAPTIRETIAIGKDYIFLDVDSDPAALINNLSIGDCIYYTAGLVTPTMYWHEVTDIYDYGGIGTGPMRISIDGATTIGVPIGTAVSLCTSKADPCKDPYFMGDWVAGTWTMGDIVCYGGLAYIVYNDAPMDPDAWDKTPDSALGQSVWQRNQAFDQC